MIFFKKLKQLKSYKFTIMIIPDANKKVIQLNLSKLFLYTMLGITVIISSYFVTKNIYLESLNDYYVSYSNGLNDEIAVRDDKIEKLYALRAERENEMAYLKDSLNTSALYFEEKLGELHDLEGEVNSLLVMINDRGDTALSIPISRSIDQSTLLAINEEKINEPTAIDEVKNLVDEDEISLMIKNQIDQYKNLIDDVSSQLSFLECYPDYSPVNGYITSNFGYRRDPFTGLTDYHKGVDIAAPKGSKIYAAASGVVTYVGYNGNYGNMIVISHGYDYETVYAHNSENLVAVGDQVTKGDLIGYVGSTGRSTGPHVHFEVHFEGTQINPRKTLNDY
ncbi:MAG: peptidoglycan DD-metalloendopeptidase family protein [Clostridiales bacterium]|nr:peptidoglycan DD-metalloendopeptidase family protein [Clostridiales bacterium]